MRTPPPRQDRDASESRALRLAFLAVLVVGLLVLLLGRIWYLQVLAGDQFREQAAANVVRTATIDAPRGRVLDRHGEPLVGNTFALTVSIQPREMGERADEVLERLGELLDEDPDELRERAERSRVGPFRPKPIAEDVPLDVVTYLHEHPERYPGVHAEQLPERDYPHGSLASHLVGYLGEVSEEELEADEFAEHRPGDLVGRFGVERSYEHHLRGEPGARRFEVDRTDRIVRELERDEPRPGADVRLHLEIEAQRTAEEALVDGMQAARGAGLPAPAGTAVVLDPRDGAVRAMASVPDFEPERFVGGVDVDYWQRLQDPDEHVPLLNRAIQSTYPPGSVFKAFTAAAARQEGFLGPGEALGCPASLAIGQQRFPNWRGADAGAMGLTRAMADSCNTFFYALAYRMWQAEERAGVEQVEDEILSDHVRRWGLEGVTGVDLPGERAGVVPGRVWRREFWERSRDRYCDQRDAAEEGTYAHRLFGELCEQGYVWRPGDQVNMSIGQGDVQLTPLGIAVAYGAIANGGTLWEPRVVEAVLPRDGDALPVEPRRAGSAPADPEVIGQLQTALEAVTQPGGTAAAAFAGFDVPVAGKTGTAQMSPRENGSWFAAYAPADDPRYVVVVNVEEGGGGSQTAAPIVRRILEGLLGLEETAIDTAPDLGT